MTVRARAAAACVAIGLGLLPAVAVAERSQQSVFSTWRATGGQLFRAYSAALMAKDTARLRTILAPSFMIQRGNGQWATKATYLAALPSLKAYTLTNVHSVRAGRSLTMRATTTSDLVVDGVAFRTTAAPMLAVFNWDGARWRLAAQANFNVPR